MPSGWGRYSPRLLSGLATDFSWLISRRLGFSQPTGMGRLVRGGEFSYKNDNRELIDKICQVTWAKFHAQQLHEHKDFIELLEGKELGRVVLAAPGPEGCPCARTSEPFGRGYRHGVAIKGNNDSVIWLAGAVCRPAFTSTGVENQFARRQARFADPSRVFKRFKEQLEVRFGSQRMRYVSYQQHTRVCSHVFDWLDPEYDSLLCLSLDTMKVSSQMAANSIQLPEIKISGPATFRWDDASMPEAAYPYYSDLEHKELDITDPQAWFSEDVDEPSEDDGWMPIWLEPPSLSPDKTPSGQVPDESGIGSAPALDGGRPEESPEIPAELEVVDVEINPAGTGTDDQAAVPEGGDSAPQPAGLIAPDPGPVIPMDSGTTQADEASIPAPAAEDKEIVPIPSAQAPVESGIMPAPGQDGGKLEEPREIPAGSKLVAVEINQEDRRTDDQPSVPEGGDSAPQPAGLIAPDPGPVIPMDSGTTQADEASIPAPAAEEKAIVPIPSGQAPDEPGIVPTPGQDDGKLEEPREIPAGSKLVAVEINHEDRRTDDQPSIPEGAASGPQLAGIIAPAPGPDIAMGSGKTQADDTETLDLVPEQREIVLVPTGHAPNEPEIGIAPDQDESEQDEPRDIPAGSEVVPLEDCQAVTGTAGQTANREGADSSPQPTGSSAPQSSPSIMMGSGRTNEDDAGRPVSVPEKKRAIPAQVFSPPVDPNAKKPKRLESLKPKEGKTGKLRRAVANVAKGIKRLLPEFGIRKIAPQSGQPSTAIKPKPPEQPAIKPHQPKSPVITTHQPKSNVVTINPQRQPAIQPNQPKSPTITTQQVKSNVVTTTPQKQHVELNQPKSPVKKSTPPEPSVSTMPPMDFD